jgi:hypothetical protein
VIEIAMMVVEEAIQKKIADYLQAMDPKANKNSLMVAKSRMKPILLRRPEIGKAVKEDGERTLQTLQMAPQISLKKLQDHYLHRFVVSVH